MKGALLSISDFFLQTFAISKRIKLQLPPTSHLKDFSQSFRMVMDFSWLWPTVKQLSAHFRWTLRHLDDETLKNTLATCFLYTAPFFTF